ncbi:3-hydroxybutyrate oligomer hydrolase family protein [Comamonas badia]|uniref:3-hydroxybutyrate oligomer hydrolase family protein n=1 Tax=Comamonas badia TaxID=265291 RepID=UPI000411C161|nr:3-hydroxybutyrate oligomer hydrolase family protein [Comamonas badia]
MRTNERVTTRWAATALAIAALAACGGGSSKPTNDLPAGITEMGSTDYRATTAGTGATAAAQDLLTGGIGKTGLGAAAAPAYADPASPSVAELRRNAIFSNYRGILDYTPGGGYGSLYGPNVTLDGHATADEGLIPGIEYVAVLDDGSKRKQTVIAVQVPDSFSASSPCIVIGASSGSRGVYGAIGTAGEWGLKKGCAVALTDAGKGVGLHNLSDDTVNKIDGTRAARGAAGALSFFTALSDAARTAYNTAFPNRIAIKHAHSQQNPERDWGTDTLAAGRYALYVLNARYGTADDPVPFTAGNTLVIAGSASNGGAASLRAAEQDGDGLIDGVVASEPVTEMPTAGGYGIQFDGAAVAGYGKTLAEYTTYGNIYQPCAALAANAALSEISVYNYLGLTGTAALAGFRCDSLADKGLVSGATTAERAADALAKLHAYGWTEYNDTMHNAHYALGNGPILSAMYTMAYGRFAADANLCNTSFAAVNPLTGNVVAAAPAALAQSFATANGTANGTPATVIYNDSVGGAKAWQFAVSPSTLRFDFGLDNALCQHALVTGRDPVTGDVLTATSTPTKSDSDRVRAGIAEVLHTANLRGKPAIIVAGRSDALVPVNDNARAYTALNRTIEGASSKLRYIEVMNGQHFDAFLPFSGFDTRFVPLHPYFNQAMNAMWDHLKKGAALPDSQVVRATPRGGMPGAANTITAANVPPFVATPAAADRIGYAGTSIAVPR